MLKVLVVALLWGLVVGTPDDVDNDVIVKKAVEGEDAVVVCNVTVSPDVDVYWSRDGQAGVYQRGARLQFTNISRAEHGHYTCHSVNTSHPADNETVETVYMDVLYPAEIVQFSVDPPEPFENKSMTFTCSVQGNPAPVLEMRKNYTSEVFHRGNQSGLVSIGKPYMQWNDSGHYMCTGRNALNRDVNVTREQDVNVICAARPRPDQGSHYTNFALIGWDVIFFENVIGYPYPNYTWSRPSGQPMGNVEIYDYPSVAVINITNVQMSDFGQYILNFSNPYGSHRSVFTLYQYGATTTMSPPVTGLPHKTKLAVIAVSAGAGVCIVGVASALIVYRVRMWRKFYKPYRDRLVN